MIIKHKKTILIKNLIAKNGSTSKSLYIKPDESI